jgi:ribosomal protein S18 acetylase RimI-like enzyme
METDYTFSFLKAQDMAEVHNTFLKAFADYFVPIQLTVEQFQAKLKRESIAPAFCVAAYTGSEMVGFILTGLGEFGDKPTAYNAGTGVVPGQRGHQLTHKMYSYLLPKLRESGIEQCLLEVIQENEPALRSYKTMGLHVTRSLDCYRAKKDDLLFAEEELDGITITSTTRPDWKTYRHFWDVEPTWQNTGSAIAHTPDEKVILEAREEGNELIGYAVFFPKIGSIAQLAVMPDKRGNGVGKALLKEVLSQTIAPALLVINVDTTAVELKTFLERRHFTRFLGQYEMVLEL